MLIKYQALAQNLQKKLHPLYILTGQDHYLLNDAAVNIKKACRQQGETDEKILHINTPADWDLLIEEANSYSLFAENVLLDVRYDKKSLDSVGKKTLQNYLQQINPRCLIILRAVNTPNKQLVWLTNHEQVLIIQAYPLTAAALQGWINTQLQSRGIRFEPQIPALIHQYTQGNMLACAQTIEKLVLISNKQDRLTIQDVQSQLTDQCDYQLFELADACLNAHTEKAIHLLQQVSQNRTEPTLILWLLTQEIRLLMQLSLLLKQSVTLSTACSQLKIWPQRAQSYNITLRRLPISTLYQLLTMCQQLDERIKSNTGNQVWHGLEQIALVLCKGID